MELRAPKGFASPLHIHRDEDEFFVVLSGEVRVKGSYAEQEQVIRELLDEPAPTAMGSFPAAR